MNEEKSIIKKEQAGAVAIANFEADSGKGLGNLGQEDLQNSLMGTVEDLGDGPVSSDKE